MTQNPFSYTERYRWRSPLQRQRGSTLIELMIALTLGLVLLTLVTRLTLETRRGLESLTERGEEREAGRYAMTLFKQDLRLAGFMGTLYRRPTVPDSLPDACARTLDGLLSGLALPIQIDDRAATASRCVDGALSGVDRLVIRHADTAGFVLDAGADDDDGDGDRDDLNYGRVYLQGFDNRYTLGYCSRPGLCSALTNCPDTSCLEPLAGGLTRPVTGDESAVFGMRYRDGLLPVELRTYRVQIYYLRSWSASPADGIPTLVRAELQDKGTVPGFSTYPLLDNVAHLRLQYGLNGQRPSQPQEWAAVSAVRVHLLIRSQYKQATHYTERSFDLGDDTPYTVPVEAQTYRHRVLTSLISLDNAL